MNAKGLQKHQNLSGLGTLSAFSRVMNNLGHLLCFPSLQHHHTRPHTSFSQPALGGCQIPKTLLITLIIWGDELRIAVHWKRSCRDHSSEIPNRPPQLEAPPHFSSSPRGTVAREQRVTLQQEMLILDLSAMFS